jgi:hypothetical protein
MPPLPPHTVENLGPREISILIVELKHFVVNTAASPPDRG